jgi:hypothetical protein
VQAPEHEENPRTRKKKAKQFFTGKTRFSRLAIQRTPRKPSQSTAGYAETVESDFESA